MILHKWLYKFQSGKFFKDEDGNTIKIKEIPYNDGWWRVKIDVIDGNNRTPYIYTLYDPDDIDFYLRITQYYDPT